jgi:hypothetical protein
MRQIKKCLELNVYILMTSMALYCVSYCHVHEWLQTGFLIFGFIEHLQVVTTNKYNIVADLHTLQITTAQSKSLPACSVFSKRFLVTASNHGYSSASVLKSSLNGGSLPTAYSSEWELLYDWRLTANQFVLAIKPWDSRPVIFFQLNTCGYSPYVTSSVTRAWVCHLQLLLVPASTQSFSSPSPVGLMTAFYCLRFETPQTLKTRSPYLYPSGTGWPGFTVRHWVPFSSPPTTLRATVEVFDPASTSFLAPVVLLISPRRGPQKKTSFPKVPLLLRADCCRVELFLRDRYLETALHATLYL